MATQIPGTVAASLVAKLDTLELTEEEHTALALMPPAGLFPAASVSRRRTRRATPARPGRRAHGRAVWRSW